MKPYLFVCGAVFAGMALAAPARAQIESREGIALQNQILELRQELQGLQQLQGQANGAGYAPQPVAPPDAGAMQAAPGGSDAVAQLVVRVGSLEEQMRELQGKVAELSNAEQRDHDELAKQVGDLAFKLGVPPASAAGGLSAPPGAPPPAGNDPGAGSPAAGMDLSAPPPPPVAEPVRHTPEQALKQGNAALARRDYAAAEASAREALALGGPRGADARFLLARALAGQHQFKEAAPAFFAVYKASPKSPRGAEGLLGVANALIGMSDNKDACQAVAKFGVEFPHADAALKQAAASARKRAGCH